MVLLFMNAEQVKNWLKKARHDLSASGKLLGQDKVEETDVICFHCQQAVEKLLKAYLCHINQPIEKTHSIEKLVLLCTKHNKKLESLHNIIGNISYYAVEIRYPDDFYMPTVAEAKEALNIAQRVESIIRKLLL